MRFRALLTSLCSGGVTWIIALLAMALGAALLALARLWVQLRKVRAESAQPVPAEAGEDPEQRALLQGAFDAAEIGIIIIDQAGLVAFSNNEAQRFIGARHGEAVAEARLREILGEVLASQRPQRQELDLYTPVRRVLGLTAAPLGDGDGAVVFVDDLTERHRLNEVRRDFVANVGHELKTPLGAMSILAEALEIVDDPGERSRLADRVTSEAQRMSKIIKDLIELARVEAQGAPRRPVSLQAVFDEAVAPVQVAADELGVKLIVEPVPDLSVAGDHGQLMSAVSNLLDNAVKYTAVADRKGGEVRLSAEPESGRVHIRVQDQGIGIPASQVERVFERFYRVDRGRSRDTGGTGLGLSIVRHVALNHGGEVSVESEEAVGSTFTLSLPPWEG